jgi:hypothetical protein
MFNLFSSNIKFKETYINNIKQINIIYPKMNVQFSKDILKNILKETPLYVYINTSLSFLDYEESNSAAKDIRMFLSENGIEYMHKFMPDTSNRDTILGLIKIGKKDKKCNVIAFAIPQNTDNSKLSDILIKVGSHIFAPIDNTIDQDTLNNLLHDNYEDTNAKLNAFKFSFFLTNLNQISIRTNYLSIDDVKKFV